MKDVWIVKYGEHTIRVVNTWTNEKLFVDGVLQDEQVGLHLTSRLFGKVRNENNEYEKIKVSVGFHFCTMQCRIFVGDCLIYTTKLQTGG
ncbi:hypothetical protein A1A1_04852 [Planococcus antarcticus DSM 14505]|uniref:Uncharacterized protein n=1 Tax=Planococcus antarcticus DSM 14505 TaxID=1185653 RepID=A0A1C7DEM9_9BACL|nr:hypothetical protein [Planococcus antarcticus]ANU09877.1 hypothetical protein BBH88_05985 [Planococcus antarcticus DSM 14505]EIM07510.1 hypothetical protein A1A1_04852 [Planococcus antarcticus DSM 14505]